MPNTGVTIRSQVSIPRATAFYLVVKHGVSWGYMYSDTSRNYARGTKAFWARVEGFLQKMTCPGWKTNGTSSHLAIVTCCGL